MDSFDIIIVGGGVAGATADGKYRQAGGEAGITILMVNDSAQEEAWKAPIRDRAPAVAQPPALTPV
jgi:NADPH-dependent 2,4-dienoyl-CoA reductase/sulfur reductase-like enzyme